MSGWSNGNRAKCTKCGSVLRSSEPGECFRCRSGRARPDTKQATRGVKTKRRDADDAVLDRAGFGEEQASAAAAAPADEAPPASGATEPPKTTWFDRFVQLHQALGLDPHEAIETHCRAWVEETTERALGPLTLVKSKPKPRQRAPANGVTPLGSIGDDYEKARQQAEAAGE